MTMTPRRGHVVAAGALMVAFSIGRPATAQLKPPRAEVTAVAPSSPVRPGAVVLLSLKVRLPEGIHVQSDKPKDALLIPTVLTLKAPSGVVVDRIVYPKATDFTQAGGREPLSVFDGEFAIEARVRLAADVPAGELILPAQLRYQACDASMCYAPARADAQWTLSVAR
jgi:DsbC/DsbD-like thiol-disulfide interchange protein